MRNAYIAAVAVWSLILVAYAVIRVFEIHQYGYFDSGITSDEEKMVLLQGSLSIIILLVLAGIPWIFLLFNSDVDRSYPLDGSEVDRLKIQRAVDIYMSKYAKFLGWSGAIAVLLGVMYVGYYLPFEAAQLVENRVDIDGIMEKKAGLELETENLKEETIALKAGLEDLREESVALEKLLKETHLAAAETDFVKRIAEAFKELENHNSDEQPMKSKAAQLVGKIDSIISETNKVKKKLDEAANDFVTKSEHRKALKAASDLAGNDKKLVENYLTSEAISDADRDKIIKDFESNKQKFDDLQK